MILKPSCLLNYWKAPFKKSDAQASISEIPVSLVWGGVQAQVFQIHFLGDSNKQPGVEGGRWGSTSLMVWSQW